MPRTAPGRWSPGRSASGRWDVTRPLLRCRGPRAEVALAIENQRCSDVDVYRQLAGERIPAGMVPGIAARIGMVRPDVVGASGPLQFQGPSPGATPIRLKLPPTLAG